MKKTGIFLGALGACLVVALVVGFAGAAVATPHGFGKAPGNETASGKGHAIPVKIIDQLENQGVDVSAVRSAIQNGDTAALKSWLTAYRSANPRNQTGNETRPGLTNIVDKLEKQGVDVSAARTAIQNGDTTALKSWLAAYRSANPRNQTGNETRPGLTNIVDKLENQGIDVSAARTAIQNGDTAALKSWLEEFRASHKDMIRGNRTGGIVS